MKGSPGGNYRNGIGNEGGKRRKIQAIVRGESRNIKKSRKDVGNEVGKKRRKIQTVVRERERKRET